MATSKTISALPAAGALTGAEVVPLTQSSVTFRTTMAAIGAYARSGSATPTIPTDFKDNCDCATTANVALTGEQTIDGFTTFASRVLVKSNTAGGENGIWLTDSGVWTRTTDADISAEVTSGMLVYVTNGTANGNQVFVLSTADPIVLGTTALTFAPIALPVTVFVSKTVSTTTYTHVLNDSGKRLNLTNAATKTIMVAPNSSVASANNTEIEVFNVGVGLATLAPGAGVTLNSLGAVLTITQYQGVKIKKRSANVWDVTGILPAASSGTVTATGGILTSNAVVLGAGTTDAKVAAGITTDGTSRLQLGVAGGAVGGVELRNATSGTMSIVPPTGALGTTVLTGLAASDTLVGVAATQTLTNKTLTDAIVGTQSPLDSSTKAASTGYVDAAVTAGGGGGGGGGGGITRGIGLDMFNLPILL
jgi:uncharacterized cupin superfamily protein